MFTTRTLRYNRKYSPFPTALVIALLIPVLSGASLFKVNRLLSKLAFIIKEIMKTSYESVKR